MAKKALLMILDGWGIGKHGKGDVIFNTPTPYLDLLTATSAHSQLAASGEDVGLPDGQMGNSEVGHLNIGAGRIVYQDLVKINRACKDGSIMENPQVKAAYSYAKENNKKLHLMGLTSDGGVHSSLDHLFKLIEIGKAYGLKNQVFVHCYMDGRDTDPRSGKGFIQQVSDVCAANDAAIASIVGRFYAMDRDKRWERVKEGYDLIVNGTGKQATDMVQAMQESYDEGVTDEFIKPIHNASVNGCIEEGDVVIFINFRNDRAKEMTIALTQEDMPEQGMKTIPGLQYYCMTPYDANFKGVNILFPKENVEDTLGEYLSKQGKKQLHTAETEKYAHVTFFFNGGREAPYEGEDRILVASPKVATYDLKPEMSAFEVKDKLVAAINTQMYDFIVVNFANGDMVGHTGVYNAIAKAVWAVDNCVREVIEAAKANDYEAIIIADHGNADNAINPDGTPNTAHSLNPVPFIYVTNNNSATVKDGRLADVAPSILHIMGLEQPADMTGECLIQDNK
ncbi:MAG: 2,3-bisphosphoglycerate-independent phosphoglycerate mutase [Prevotella sp.]|nr:2,3-bisphosphoglycerate-independent phosphoglycerate mutase [Prevotella sp.]